MWGEGELAKEERRRRAGRRRERWLSELPGRKERLPDQSDGSKSFRSSFGHGGQSLSAFRLSTQNSRESELGDPQITQSPPTPPPCLEMSLSAATRSLRLASYRQPQLNLSRAAVSASLRPYSSPAATPPTPAPSRPAPTPTPTNLPGSNLPGASKYSPTTVKLVTGLAKLFGYHSQTSTAIRTASDYYDRCAERGEMEAPFFYEGTLSRFQPCPFAPRAHRTRPFPAQNAPSPRPSKPGSPSPPSTSGSSPSDSGPSPHPSDAPTPRSSSTTSSSTSNSASEARTPSPRASSSRAT